MKPDWCPQEVWDEADKIVGVGWGNQGQGIRQTFCEEISRALLEAEQRGRRKGPEEGAKVAATFREGNPKPTVYAAIAHAIRAKLDEVQK